MRNALWKGDISFGLVSIPVRLVSAVKGSGPSFHRLSPEGDCRLRQKLYCPETGDEYDFGETAMGYEIAPDQYVIVEKEEIEAIKPESGHTISLLDFVKLKDIDPIYFNRTYYVIPEEGKEKPYRLLVEVMRKKNMVGIAKFIMRRKEYLVALRTIHENYLAAETMHYDQDVSTAAELPDIPREKLTTKELDLAAQLLESFAGDFDPTRYKDEYRERLEDLIEKKAKGEVLSLEEPVSTGAPKVIDLMQALKKSLEEKKKAKHTSKKKRKSRAPQQKKSA